MISNKQLIDGFLEYMFHIVLTEDRVFSYKGPECIIEISPKLGLYMYQEGLQVMFMEMTEEQLLLTAQLLPKLMNMFIKYF